MTQQEDQASGGRDSRDDDITRLDNLVQTQQETVDYLVQYIERVEAQLNDRVDAVEGSLVQSRKKEARPPTDDPVNWAGLDGASVISTRQALSDFVDYLVDRYGFRTDLRPCWYEHTTAVEELTALWTAREVAFAVGADASMPSWWQDLLERSQLRLRKMFVKCRNGHVAADTAPWMAPREQARRDRWIQGESLDAFE